MDAVLEEQFERMQTALNTLVDSIAGFNPSVQAALDLLATDDALRSGLEQLSQHQANYARINALRAEEEALEAQLKASVSTLANLRHELFETPVTISTENMRPVSSTELLQFAKNISEYTVPPTYREQIPKAEPKDGEGKEKEESAPGGLNQNGTGTPTVASAPAPTQETANTAGQESQDAEQKEVTTEQAAWLKTLRENGWSWVPWPDDNKIRSGNLMMIQHLLDQKKDPWTERVPTDAELVHQVEQDRQREEEEQQQIEQQQQAHAVRMQQHAEAQRRESVAAAAGGAAPKPAPQFSGFGMLEEDDED